MERTDNYFQKEYPEAFNYMVAASKADACTEVKLEELSFDHPLREDYESYISRVLLWTKDRPMPYVSYRKTVSDLWSKVLAVRLLQDHSDYAKSRSIQETVDKLLAEILEKRSILHIGE